MRAAAHRFSIQTTSLIEGVCEGCTLELKVTIVDNVVDVVEIEREDSPSEDSDSISDDADSDSISDDADSDSISDDADSDSVSDCADSESDDSESDDSESDDCAD